jgi:hypothetical protein
MKFLKRNKPPNEDEHHVVHDARATAEEEAAIDYPHGMKLALIMTSAYLSMFLVALVREDPLQKSQLLAKLSSVQ